MRSTVRFGLTAALALAGITLVGLRFPALTRAFNEGGPNLSTIQGKPVCATAPGNFNLLQFNALVGKHISTIDSSMRQRINQFNFGLANDLASLKWLPTVPLLMLDGNGITTFKQSGKTTSLFISGSSFKKYDEKPMAYLSGDGIKNPSFFSRSNEIEISVPNASMGPGRSPSVYPTEPLERKSRLSNAVM